MFSKRVLKLSFKRTVRELLKESSFIGHVRFAMFCDQREMGNYYFLLIFSRFFAFSFEFFL